ncbi:MAG TPA: uracil-DNA glycosylase [Polyangiaceae bacterium]|nr:uracil-DNA glycosylase [Polyangiaceae bacterium]
MVDSETLSELGDLASALRAHLEWQRQCGTSGLPRGATPGLPELGSSQPVQASAVRPRQAAAPQAAAPQAPAPPVEPQPRPSGLPLDERQHRLEVLSQEVKGCTRCALHAKRTQTVFARGNGSSGLCFVGEGPGADEDAQGFPFVGPAGQLLDRMIAAMGLLRDEVYVCNIVKCRPPNNRKPEPEEMAACMPYLEQQIDWLEPQVIVALGATAVQGLLGTSEGIMRLRGKWKLFKGRIAVMPTFHPAYLLRTPAAKREVWDDLQAVLRQMGRPIPPRR